MKEKIIILGAGLTGLSTAYHLKKDYKIFEKENKVGGLCRSEKVKGFTFDYSGHWLSLRTQYGKNFIKKLLGKNLIRRQRKSFIYSYDVYTKYPFQAHTHGLPLTVIVECFIGLLKAKFTKFGEITTFKDWINASLGEGIAKHFMVPYNQKLWHVSPDEMTTEWLGRFIPKPNMGEFLRGALGISKKEFGYNISLWYPKNCGIGVLPDSFLPFIKNLNLGKEAKRIILSKRIVEFSNGQKESFDILVSTIPLPHLLKIIDDAPPEIKKMAAKLRWVSILCVNLGIGRRIEGKHWIYFPENKYIFYRVGFYSNVNPLNAPKGETSIYVEVSSSEENERDIKKIERLVLKDLIKAKIIDSNDKIITIKTIRIPIANVLFNRDWGKATGKILKYLEEEKIYSVGRYGRWYYSTMEDSILEGKEVAEKINVS